MPRSTREQLRQRVAEVFRLRIGGAEFHDLREYADAPERNWGVSDTQLRRYVAMADALCKERFDARAEHLLARHLLQRRQLYAHAMGAGDFGTALRVLQDEAKLEALYPKPEDDLRREVEELKRMLLEAKGNDGDGGGGTEGGAGSAEAGDPGAGGQG
jgi:hypothetical protein